MASEGESAAVAQPSRRRAALWSLVFAYAGQGIAVAKGIVFVPLYLRHFSLDTYGAWLASANIVAILGLMELGISTVFYQQLGHAFGAGDKRRFAGLVGGGMACMVALVAVIGLAAAAVAPFVPRLVNASADAHPALITTFVLVAIASGLNLVLVNVVAVTHAWQRTEIGGLARVAGQLVEVAVLLWCLFRGFGLVALGVGALAGAVTGTVIAAAWAAWLWQHLGLPRPTLDRHLVKEIVALGTPVAASRVATTVASNIEIALVAAFVNPTAAAVYGITERTFRVALGFVNPIAGSVLSALAHFVGARGTAAARGILQELSALWAIVVGVSFPSILALNRDFVGLWVGADKYGGFWLNLAICLSALVASRVFLSVVTLTAVGEVARTARATLVEPLVRIPLMVLGLRLAGPIGIPLASLVGGVILVGWFFPRVMAANADLRERSALAEQFTGHGAVALACTAAAVAAALLPPTRSWPEFVALAAVTGTVACALLLAASPSIRRHAALRLAAVRASRGNGVPVEHDAR